LGSYISLELDTTPPQIEIFAPRFTTRDIENHITIESNEILGSFQEIYVVDSGGTRHELNFSNEGDTLIGIVRFSYIPFGTITLFVRVKDELDNISKLYQTSIELKENISRLRMDISHNVRPLFISNESMNLIITESIRPIFTNIEIQG
jgi:hypothetical protein